MYAKESVPAEERVLKGKAGGSASGVGQLAGCCMGLWGGPAM